MLHGFHAQSVSLRGHKVSVLDAIPPCVMSSLSAKRGGGVAICLMPIREEAELGHSLPVLTFLPHQKQGAWGAGGRVAVGRSD